MKIFCPKLFASVYLYVLSETCVTCSKLVFSVVHIDYLYLSAIMYYVLVIILSNIYHCQLCLHCSFMFCVLCPFHI